MGLQVPCLPVYRRCCCFSVRTGTLILGWLYMVLLAIVFISSCAAIAEIQGKMDEADEMMMSIARKWFSFTNFNMVLGLVLCVVDGTFCAMLLHGVHKGKPSFMLPQLTTSVVTITMAMFTTIYYFIVSLYGYFLFSGFPETETEAGDFSRVPSIIFSIILVITGVMIPVEALALYFWNVMYSHYRQLEESRSGSYGKMMEMGA